MRPDLDQVLSNIAPRDAKQLQKGAYQRCFEQIPTTETIIAAIPVVSESGRGPLVVTTKQLIFVSDMGERLSAPLSKIHGSRYEEIGMFNRKPFALFVGIGGDEVRFGFGKVDGSSVSYFVGALEEAMELSHQTPPPQEPRQEFSVADELAKFAALRDQGIITDAELEARKTELLG